MALSPLMIVTTFSASPLVHLRRTRTLSLRVHRYGGDQQNDNNYLHVPPNFLLKIIPHVDGTARICELVEYYLTEVDLKGAWTGPTELTLFSHALAPLAELPVLEIVSGTHIIADLTLELGKVVHDYLA